MNGSDFGAFFEELHGHRPFPWQGRLAAEVCQTNAWPDVLDLPTGSGKTACIDIALFHWFVCSYAGAAQHASRRIAFVVDRRIIVDEAAERAQRIATRIATATSPTLVAARTLLAAGTSAAGIDVVTLRGGVERESNLARDPTSVAIFLSTVDQLGSRLLFRGYGVSDRMKPVHAGLLGVDTLLLLDEAHIAEPFQQTLRAIVREQRRSEVGHMGPKPLAWSQLSATPKNAAKETRVFSLAAEDRADPVLARRLNAKKPMRLVAVDKRDHLPKKLAELIVEELSREPLAVDEAPRIGAVVNRVASARAVHGELERVLKGSAEVELVIGRVRPIDRDIRMKDMAPKLKSSTSPRPGDKPIVVVATQTIEVGADFDFHAMFIEAAGYSAVRQRVGRLNRLGTRSAARGAIVLVRSEAKDDPVYGNTIDATWSLLESHARDGLVDLGIAGAPASAEGTAREAGATPVLSPSLVELLVQTQPRPAVEPSVSEFLHGFATEVPDVSVVWRDGLKGSDGEIDVELARAVLDVLPALSVEAMSLPISTFRQWVRGWDEDGAPKIVDTGDLDGDYGHEEIVKKSSRREVLVVSGEDVRLVWASNVKPGSKIVLPTEVGGADQYGFAPESADPVLDLTLIAREQGLTQKSGASTQSPRRAPTLVWSPAFARSWLTNVPSEEGEAVAVGISSLMKALVDDETTRDDALDAIEAWFVEYRKYLRTEVARVVSAIFEGKRNLARCEWLEVKGERRGMILRAGKASAADLADYDGGLQRTVNVPLADHSRGVADFAERYARNVGLSGPLARAMRTAGYVHDLGKADPRFQARLGAIPGELLAKSTQYDRRVAIGERHEAYSVALLDRYPELLAEHAEHADLIRYLVGTHHGFGRGLQPMTEDRGIAIDLELDGGAIHYSGKPGLGALGSGWADLFVELNRRYGPWGLAYLESLLRLADHRRSEEEINLYADEETRGEG